MKRFKKASEIFAPVDPHLKVIDRGRHKHKRSQEDEMWDRAQGVACKVCGQESFRLRDGVCIDCINKKDIRDMDEMGRQQTKRYLVREFEAGRITLSDMKAGRLVHK